MGGWVWSKQCAMRPFYFKILVVHKLISRNLTIVDLLAPLYLILICFFRIETNVIWLDHLICFFDQCDANNFIYL